MYLGIAKKMLKPTPTTQKERKEKKAIMRKTMKELRKRTGKGGVGLKSKRRKGKEKV